MSGVIISEKLEELLLANWAHFLDRTQFLRRVLEDTRNATLSQSSQRELPERQIKLSVTKMEAQISGDFEVWAEFSIPLDDGVAVGTHSYSLKLSGELDLKQTHGHIFVPETLS